jgi:vitamin B12 transporter
MVTTAVGQDLFENDIMNSLASRSLVPACKPLALAVAVSSLFIITPLHAEMAAANSDKSLTPVLVTAARMPLAVTDVMSDNIVISADEIHASGQTMLVDLLQQKRGIEIARNGGPGTSSSVFIRGANNNQSIVLIDGVRSASATSGAASWQVLPLSQIDHIEIVFGPMSSLYGADAIGGVVQIFTKKGEAGTQLELSAGAGTYGNRTLDASVAGSAGTDNRFRYALAATHESADGFSAKKPAAGTSFDPDKDGYARDSVSGQFLLEWAKGQELGLHFLQSRLDSQFDNAQFNKAINKTYFFNDRGVSQVGSVALVSKNRITPNWSSTLQLSQAQDLSDSTSASLLGTAKVYTVQTSTFDTRETGVSWQNDLTFGTDLLQLVAERRDEKVNSTQAALVRERSTNSFAAAYQLQRDNHLASIGIRNDDNSAFGSSTTGSVGYGYRISSALRVNASAGTSFRAPTFNELYFPGFGNPTNQPGKGRNTEAGLHYYDAGGTEWSVVYYRNRIANLVVIDSPTTQHTVGDALLEGMSLEASRKLGPVTLRGALDLQEPRDETTGNLLSRRARRHGSVALDYAAGPIKTGAQLVFSGPRFDDAANKAVLGGYGLLNLYASYDVAPNWSLFGRWDNVLGKDYELAQGYATPGSAVFVGVRYAMK